MKVENKKVKSKVLILLSILLIAGCTAPISSYEQTRNDSNSSVSPLLKPYPSSTAVATPRPTTNGLASGSNLTTDIQKKTAIQPPLEETKTKDNIFKDYGSNPFISTSIDKFSTFAIDVDTASYTWMRKAILSNLIPDKSSVRTEEYINYFDYNYPQPDSENKFSISTDLVKIKNTNILKVALQGKKIDNTQRKNAHLTLVIDISGSMNQENRLNLVKQSAKILTNSLTDKDYLSIVVYGANARSVIQYSNNKEKIIESIDSLQTEGSTNTEAGLNLGYKIAKENYKAGYINKVILCSDGFANTGVTSPDGLLSKIRQDAISGISLSTIGFGMGNYNDVLMEQLADKGDGSYSYVDDINEANRIFAQNLTSTLQTIAKDTKVQLSFNPQVVSEYRLIGYENRDISDNDFRNDNVDAGEVGSDQKVTALYEIKLKNETKNTDEICNVFLRYKDIDQNQTVKEINKSVQLSQLKDIEISDISTKTAVATAIYAEILKSGYWSQIFSYDDVLNYSQEAYSINENEKLREFISLVNKAKSLK